MCRKFTIAKWSRGLVQAQWLATNDPSEVDTVVLHASCSQGAPVPFAHPPWASALGSLEAQRLFPIAVPTQIPCITDCVPSCHWLSSRYLDTLCPPDHYQPQLICTPEGCFLIPRDWSSSRHGSPTNVATIQWVTAIHSPMRCKTILGKQHPPNVVLPWVLSLIPRVLFLSLWLLICRSLIIHYI